MGIPSLPLSGAPLGGNWTLQSDHQVEFDEVGALIIRECLVLVCPSGLHLWPWEPRASLLPRLDMLN